MGILHRRREVKRRFLEREACGERRSAPHEYPRASSRGEPDSSQATDVTAPAPAPRKRRKKAKARRARKAAAI